jgi:hypothetical protein
MRLPRWASCHFRTALVVVGWQLPQREVFHFLARRTNHYHAGMTASGVAIVGFASQFTRVIHLQRSAA